MATKQVIDRNYHFPTWVDLIGLVYDQSIDIRSLLNSLNESNLNDKVIRDIIFLGIQSHHTKNKNFDIVQKALASLSDLKSVKNVIKSGCFHCNEDAKQKRVSHSKSPFDVQSLHCRIFQMLDFYSIERCSVVCKDWLYRAYDKSSFWHLDLEHIMHISDQYCPRCNETSGYKYKIKYKNMNRFQNIKRINIVSWPNRFSEYFSNMVQTFRKLEQVVITETEAVAYNDPFEVELDLDKNYAREITKLLQVNCNNIKSLTFENFDDENPSEDLQKVINESIESIHFKKLHTLKLNGCIDDKQSLLKYAPDNLKVLHVSGLLNVEETPGGKLCKNVARRRDLLQNITFLDLSYIWVGGADTRTNGIYKQLVSGLTSLQVLKVQNIGANYLCMSDLIYHMRCFDHFSQLKELEFDISSKNEYLEPLDMVHRDGSLQVSEGFVGLKCLEITILSEVVKNHCKIQLQNLFDIIKPCGQNPAPLEEMIIRGSGDMPIYADNLIGLIVQSGIVSAGNLRYLEIGKTLTYDANNFGDLVCGMVQLENFLKNSQCCGKFQCFQLCVGSPIGAFLRQKERMLKTMINIVFKWYDYEMIECSITLLSKNAISGSIDHFFAELKNGKWSDRCQLKVNNNSVHIKLIPKRP